MSEFIQIHQTIGDSHPWIRFNNGLQGVELTLMLAVIGWIVYWLYFDRSIVGHWSLLVMFGGAIIGLVCVFSSVYIVYNSDRTRFIAKEINDVLANFGAIERLLAKPDAELADNWITAVGLAGDILPERPPSALELRGVLEHKRQSLVHDTEVKRNRLERWLMKPTAGKRGKGRIIDCGSNTITGKGWYKEIGRSGRVTFNIRFKVTDDGIRGATVAEFASDRVRLPPAAVTGTFIAGLLKFTKLYQGEQGGDRREFRLQRSFWRPRRYVGEWRYYSVNNPLAFNELALVGTGEASVVFDKT